MLQRQGDQSQSDGSLWVQLRGSFLLRGGWTSADEGQAKRVQNYVGKEDHLEDAWKVCLKYTIQCPELAEMGGVKVLGVSLLLAKNDLWPTWVTTGNVTTTEPSEITFRGSILYRERLDSSGEKMAYQGPKLTKLFQLREVRWKVDRHLLRVPEYVYFDAWRCHDILKDIAP